MISALEWLAIEDATKGKTIIYFQDLPKIPAETLGEHSHAALGAP